MLKRCWSLLKSWVGDAATPPEPFEDPEVLLADAQRALRDRQVRDRERAVHVITEKNRCQQAVKDARGRLDNLDAKVALARKRGDADLAERLQAERPYYETALAEHEIALARALETVERIKLALHENDERLRQKTAEARALKAEWQRLQTDYARFRRETDVPRGPGRGRAATAFILVALAALAFLVGAMRFWV
jgi:phage shock protein A